MSRETRTSAGPGFGWWAVPLIGVVVLVNLAGIWEITTSLRTLRRHGEQQIRLTTASRAAAIESLLAGTMVDLAFVANSPSLLGSAETGDEGWRTHAGLALLLFLRGHPLVDSIIVRDGERRALIEAGRPRGVPGYWFPGPDTPAAASEDAPFRRSFELAGADVPGRPARLDAWLDAAVLTAQVRADDDPVRASCELLDASGNLLLGTTAGDSTAPAFEATLSAGGRTESGRWSLRCRSTASSPGAVLEPLVARQRTTIVVNLIVMVLAIGLGLFALRLQRIARRFEHRVRRETRVRELERQLFHAERLSTVGRLAAGMAHEINNPLEGISNYLELAEDAVDRGESDRALKHLGGVRQGLERAAGIVRRVLDHADPSAAINEIIDLRGVVSEASDFVRSRQEFAGIHFAVDLPGEPLHVRGNGVMLGQVFLNLILNACEAQPDNGEVLVSARRVSDRAQVDVADRGPGVPESLRSRIFEPFESTKRSAGLGLSICHSILEQHGGQVTLLERDRGGALFRVSLDICPPEERDGKS